MAGKLYIEATFPTRSGADLTQKIGTKDLHAPISRLSSLFAEIDAGIAPAAIRVSADDSTGVQATQTIAPIYASLAAGDYVAIVAPNGKTLTYTCSTSAVTLGDPTFQKVTDNTATGASLAAQINADPRAFGLLTAQASSGTVTVTITQPGTIGNGFTIVKYSAGGSGWTLGAATFAGGKNAGALQSVTLTLSGTIGNDETLVIGGVTLTGKSAAPSGESQFLCAVSAAADGAALVACINAHTKLKGLISASGTSSPVLTYQEGGRVGALVSLSETMTNGALSATSFAPSTTEAWASSVSTFSLGATVA